MLSAYLEHQENTVEDSRTESQAMEQDVRRHFCVSGKNSRAVEDRCEGGYRRNLSDSRRNRSFSFLDHSDPPFDSFGTVFVRPGHGTHFS